MGNISPKSRAYFVCWSVVMATLAVSTGCQTLLSPISGVPAHRLPPEFFAKPKNNLIPVDVSRLRQPPPRNYLLDAGDILGIWIPSLMGATDEAGNPATHPPIHMPEPGSDLPPAVGVPILVREDGTISVPHVPPIQVRGLTLTQVENVLRRAYTIDQEILQPGKDQIIVSVMRPRRYSVVVMRKDGITLEQTSNIIELPAYQNDVLHALAETGGLPGVEAKNEVLILRSSLLDAAQRDEYIRQFYARELPDPCICYPPLPDDPAVIRIPLRLPPGQTPQFSPEDIILEEGDVVVIETREREVFYMMGLGGGGGGEIPLPRDYDLDVIGALSMGGGSFLQTSGGRGGGGGGFGGGGGGGLGAGAVGGVPPGRLFIIRKTPCNGQIIITVDLNRAINNPASRPLVQPEDILVLQHKPEEEILNFALGTFFTFGIADLVQNRR